MGRTQVQLQREKLELNPVFSTAMQHGDHMTGYIRLVNFSQKAAPEMQHAIAQLQVCSGLLYIRTLHNVPNWLHSIASLPSLHCLCLLVLFCDEVIKSPRYCIGVALCCCYSCSNIKPSHNIIIPTIVLLSVTVHSNFSIHGASLYNLNVTIKILGSNLCTGTPEEGQFDARTILSGTNAVGIKKSLYL